MVLKAMRSCINETTITRGSAAAARDRTRQMLNNNANFIQNRVNGCCPRINHLGLDKKSVINEISSNFHR